MDSVSHGSNGAFTFNGRLLVDLTQSGTTLPAPGRPVYSSGVGSGNKPSLLLSGFVVQQTSYSLKAGPER